MTESRKINVKVRELLMGIGQLRALKQLTLCDLRGLKEMPDPSGLTRLESLRIEYSMKITALLAAIKLA